MQLTISQPWRQSVLPLFLILLFAACHGQQRTLVPKEPGSEALATGHPKMLRTQGLQTGNVGCALLDSAGNLWFGTTGEGLYRYDGKYFTNFTREHGLGSNSINALIEDRAGRIVLATGGGIYRYDGKSFAPLTANDDISKSGFSSVCEDRAGNLWLGTMNDGVYRYDGKTFTHFLVKNDLSFLPLANKDTFNFNVGHQSIIDIAEDRHGNLWFCTWNRGGVWRYDGRVFTNYLPSADYYRPNDGLRDFGKVKAASSASSAHITDDMIFSVTEDRAGNLWFATRDHGVCRFDGQVFTVLHKEQGFTSRGAYSIHEDRNGNLWFTTEKDGVWRYDGQSFTHFTTKDGLINDSVFCMTEDRAGNLWFGTREFGLCRFDGNGFSSFSEVIGK